MVARDRFASKYLSILEHLQRLCCREELQRQQHPVNVVRCQ